MVSGTATPIATSITPFRDAGWSKLDVVPGGGGIAGVGVALLVVVAIVSAVVQLKGHSCFVKGFGSKEMEEDVKDSRSLVLVLSL